VATNSPPSIHHERPPLYRDVTVVKWVVQIVALLLTLGALWFLANQAGDNLRASNVPTDYDFLSVNPGIDLSSGIDTDPDTGGRALWVGMVNTLRMAIAGILVATILGVVVGLARLSNNWLLKKIGTVFVETLRNVPLLVQILFYGAVFASLDRVTTDVGPINGWLHISNKGLSMPRAHIADGFYQWMIVLLIGLVAANFLRKRRIAQQDATGEETYPVLSAFGLIVVFGVIGWFIHPIFGFVGKIFESLSSVVSSVPETVLQLAIGVLCVGASAYWIRSFLNSRRTPAGLAKLTDDDYFRMIFAAVGGVIGAVFFLVLWPGLSSWMINSASDLFEVLGNKFGDGRTGRPLDVDLPNVVQTGKFPNYGPSGLNFSIGFAAVFFGVVFYTAAFVAEIVRGGILAVPKGQTEAAASLGLRRSTALRRVIIPQALRVMLPPLGNQYLNLTKNTSLAIAVGYSDIVQVGQTVYNQTGKTLPVVSIWMFFYLSCSLSISVIVNFFNVRMKIVER
jgi:general L-amino acid transport system permease protein